MDLDVSPEPTIILRTMKDFNQFISSGRKPKDNEMSGLSSSKRLRLNFSDAGSDCSLMDDSSVFQNPKKRKLDEASDLTGLDVARKFRDKDVELSEARATILMLKGKLQNTDANNRKSSANSENELANLKRKQSRDKELIDDLQHKIKRLQTQQQETLEESRRIKNQCNKTTYDSEKRMIDCHKEYIEKNEQLEEEVAFLRQRVMELTTELEEKICETETTQSQLEETEQQLELVKDKIPEANENKLKVEILELNLQQANSKIKFLELQLEELSEYKTKNDVFEKTVARFQIVEKENARLQEENKYLEDTALNTRLMEERLLNAKKENMALETRCENLANIRAKADHYKDQLKQLEDVVINELRLKERPTLAEIKRLMNNMRKQDDDLSRGVDGLSCSLKTMEKEWKNEQAENKKLKEKIKDLENASEQNSIIIKRLQRKLLILTQERDSLKNIITTYEAELTINYSIVSQERIEKLESQLQLYREELKLMEEELEDAYKFSTGGTVMTPQKRDRSERTLNLEKRVKELEEEVSKLRETKENLEGRLENLAMRGDYDASQTKVLHFKDNPLSNAIANREKEFEKLEKENEALRKRVSLLEEGEQLDLTQKVGMKIASEGSQKEVKELKENLSNMETRNKRMMDIFRKTSKDLREAIYLITGYRVDGVGNEAIYKLTNMYSESSDDFFRFELQPGGDVRLMETPYSQMHSKLMEVYLKGKNSLPAFMSAVTLELFEREHAESSTGIPEDMENEEEDEMGEEEREKSPSMSPVPRSQISDQEHEDEDEDEMEGEEEEEEDMEDEEEDMEDDEEEEGYEEGRDREQYEARNYEAEQYEARNYEAEQYEGRNYEAEDDDDDDDGDLICLD